VTIDPEALATRPEEIEEAVCIAAQRALASSAREALAPRGAYLAVRLNAPRLTWSGEALGTVPGSQRDDLERRMKRAFETAAQAAGVLDGNSRLLETPAPLSGPFLEPFDPGRYDEWADAYLVPAYDKGGKTAQVKHKAKKEPVKMEEVEEWLILPEGWYQKPALWRALTQLVVDRWGDPPDPPYGYIWFESKGGKGRKGGGFRLLVVLGDGSTLTSPFLGLFRTVNVTTTNGRKSFEQEDAFPVPSPGFMRFLSRDDVATMMADETRTLLRADESVQGQVSRDELSAQEEEQVRTRVERDMAVIQGAWIMEVSVSGIGTWWGMTHKSLPGTVTLFPISRTAKVAVKAKADKKTGVGGADVGPAGAGEPGAEAKGEGKEKGGDGGEGGGGGAGGEGKAPGDGRGDGEAAGGDKGDGEGKGVSARGGFVYTGMEGKPGDGALFPESHGRGRPRVCESFYGEPKIDELGPDGEEMKGLIDEIAYKLGIGSCAYAGNFCLAAAEALGGRAVAIGDAAMDSDAKGLIEPVKLDRAKLGSFRFVPTASVAIQFMRHFAEVTPRISALSQKISVTYVKPQYTALFEGFRRNDPYGWLRDFGSDLNGIMKDSLAALFITTCRILMMQYLRTSAVGLKQRLDKIEGYAVLFEELVRSELMSEDELHRMLDALRAVSPDSNPLKELGREVYSSWKSARSAFLNSFEGRDPFEGIHATAPGTIVYGKNGTPGIQDSRGRIWSIEELEKALAVRRDTANSIDPLVAQVTGDPRLMGHFIAHPENTKIELVKLLTDMQRNNDEMQRKVRNDRRWAFEASKIVGDDDHATIPGTSYALTGIHLQAHKQIAEFFRGSTWYPIAVQSLFSAQEAWENFKGFIEFAGVIIVTIVCAPLGEVLGVALALYHEAEALEKERLYQSLLDPELVISRADVEAGLFAAELGVVLSFIPVAGRILKAGAKPVEQAVGKAVARELAEEASAEGASTLARGATAYVTRSVVRALQSGLAEAFVVEMAKAEVINELLGKMLVGPAIEQLQRDYLTATEIAQLQAQGR
jgi:hypothetical protein